MEIMLWLLTGFWGRAGIWRTFTWHDKPHQKCPTPRVIATWVAVSPAGPFLIIFAIGGLIGCVVEYLQDNPKTDSWWTRLLCHSGDDARR